MSIKVACVCGKRFVAKDDFAGRRTKCPGCGQPLVIPQVGSAADELEVLDDAGPPGGWLGGAAPAADPFGGGLPGSGFSSPAAFPASSGFPADGGFGQPGGLGPLPGGFPAGAGGAFGGPLPGAGPFMSPAFPPAAPPKKKKSSNHSAALWIVGLAVVIGTPCLGMVGCTVLGVVGAARQAAQRQTRFPTALPTSTYNPLGSQASAETQAANDAYLESYIKLLEDYANSASQIRDLSSAEAHGDRVDELARQINSQRFEVQMKLSTLPASEDQRIGQKYGARLKAAQERLKREDDRLLSLSTQLHIDAIRSGFDRSYEPPSLPPLPTTPPDMSDLESPFGPP